MVLKLISTITETTQVNGYNNENFPFLFVFCYFSGDDCVSSSWKWRIYSRNGSEYSWQEKKWIKGERYMSYSEISENIALVYVIFFSIYNSDRFISSDSTERFYQICTNFNDCLRESHELSNYNFWAWKANVHLLARAIGGA